MKQGFRLVPNTCNWIDADGGIDASIYPVEDDAYGVTKFRIQYRHQVAAPVDPTRRHFLSQAAGLAASATALTMASRSAVPEIDPAFTLIAEKRAADIVHGKAIDTLTAESQLPPVDSTRR
jgi:hypothetical protein